MTASGFLRVAIVLLLGVVAASAQEPLETRGAWSLVPEGEDFAVRTAAIGAPDSTFSVICRKTQRKFGFEIKSPALPARPPGEDSRIGFKVDGGDQVWLTLPAGTDGTMPLTHETAVWLIDGALKRDGAKDIAFTVDGHTWQFALDGFAGLKESLATRCGFPLVPPPPPGR